MRTVDDLPMNAEVVETSVRVLVVDDQPSFRGLVRIWLRDGVRMGVEIDEAESLEEMRARVRERRPDVVLLDQRLPDGDGLDGARELLAADPDTAVLLLTGMSDALVDEEAERVGVADFLVKHEVDGPMLARAVRYAARRREDARRLRRSEGRYRDLVRTLPDAAVLVVDDRLRFVMAGGAALAASGMRPDDIVGADAVRLLESSGRAHLIEHYRAALAGEERTIEFTAPTGRTYRTHFRRLGAPDTGVAEAMAISFDVTEQLRQAADLQRAQAIARVGSWTWDALTDESRWSPELYRVMGLDPEQLPLGLTASLDLLVDDPEDRAALEEGWARTLTTGEEIDLEFALRDADGRPRVLRTRFRGVPGPDGTMVRIDGVTRDVTAQRRAEAERAAVEAELAEAQLRYRLAFESAGSGAALLAPDGRVLEVNEEAAAMLGRTVEELVGSDGLALVAPEERDVARAEMAAALAGGERHGRYERRFVHADGHVVHTVMTTGLACDADGTPRYFTLQLLDLTEQLEARAERDRARALLESTLDQLPAHVVLKDLQGRIEFVNASTARFLDRPQEELLGLTNDDVFEPGSSAETDAIERQVIAERRSIRFENRVSMRDGRESVFSRIKFPIFDADGEVRSTGAMAWDVTAIREAEEALRAGREHYRLVLDNLPRTIVAAYDTDLRMISIEGSLGGVDEYVRALVGKTPAEFLDEKALAIIEPALRRGLAGEEVQIDFEASMSGRRLDIAVAPYRDAGGAIVGAVVITRDMTEQRAAERAQAAAERRFQVAFDRAPIGMSLSTRDGRLLRVNEAWSALTGYGGGEAAALAPLAYVHPGDAEMVRHALDGLDEGAVAFEHRIEHVDGSTVWAQVHATLVQDDDDADPHVLAQVEDITERRQYEDRLQHLAHHDPLTGLLNRRGFGEALETHLSYTRRYGTAGALLVIDLDGFKYINDTLGHSAGDELIVACAGALRRRLRESDVLARIGGDEFAVLLPSEDPEQAAQVAGDLVAAVREQAAGFGGQCAGNVTASIGVAAFVPEIATAEEMLVNADLAMYEAKEGGKDRFAVHRLTGDEPPRIKATMGWLQRIDRALETDGFELHAQPIFDLARSEVVGHEVLLRLRDDDGALVLPGAFLGIAERFGMIRSVDAWVLRHAIRAMGRVRELGGRLPLAVNVSGISAGDPKLVELIGAELRAAGVAAPDLTIELTETAAVADIPRARAFAEAVRGLGCRFALDDFGAGFGSFFYLKHLPFDVLKIDGEFVKNAAHNATDRLVISAVTEIARGLGKNTVAEFVPDDPTIGLLLRHGVDWGQGHHLGAPEPLERLLASHATNLGYVARDR